MEFIPGTGLFLMGLVAFACLAFWLYILLDIIRSQFPGPNEKLLWVLVVLFAPFIGAILYLVAGRRNKISKHHK